MPGDFLPGEVRGYHNGRFPKPCGMAAMATLWRLSGIALALLVLAGPAAAQGKPPIMRNDRDGDGRLSADEFPGPAAVFQRLDTDRDGFVTVQELRQGRRGGNQTPGMGGGQRQPTAAPAAGVPVRALGFPGMDVHLHLHYMDLGEAMGGTGSRPRPGSKGEIREKLGQAADALVGMLDQRGIHTALVVTVPFHSMSPEENFDAITAAVGRHPTRLRHLGGGARLKSMLQDIPADRVGPAYKEEFRRIANAVLDEGALGFGEMISYHLCMTERHSFQYAPPDHPLFLVLADVAAARGVAIDLHMEAIGVRRPMPANMARKCSKNPSHLEPTVPGLERLLAHNRGARVVWQHIGWDNTGEMTLDLLSRLLDRHSNLFLALRVPQHPPAGRILPNRITDPSYRITNQWLAFMEKYPDRLVIGSDEFVSPGGGNDLAPSFDRTWNMVPQLPPGLAAKIGGANARRIYGF